MVCAQNKQYKQFYVRGWDGDLIKCMPSSPTIPKKKNQKAINFESHISSYTEKDLEGRILYQ